MAKRTRTAPWDRRRDKNGGFARTRRYEKALLRRGYREVSKAVWCFVGERMSDGKGSLTIYRDVVVRDFKRGRRPDAPLSYYID